MPAPSQQDSEPLLRRPPNRGKQSTQQSHVSQLGLHYLLFLQGWFNSTCSPPQGFFDVSYRIISHHFPSLGGDTGTATLSSLLPVREVGISNWSSLLKLKLANSIKSSGGEQTHAPPHSLLSQETWVKSNTCLREIIKPRRSKANCCFK